MNETISSTWAQSNIEQSFVFPTVVRTYVFYFILFYFVLSCFIFSLVLSLCFPLYWQQALQLVSGEFNDEFFAGGDVRMGDIVLLVDSDTRIPEDCLSKSSGERAADRKTAEMSRGTG